MISKLYRMAILYPKGMKICCVLSDLFMCRTYHVALVCKQLRQPVNSLANFQYYAYDRLPDEVRNSFLHACISLSCSSFTGDSLLYLQIVNGSVSFD
ncbi:hypothetical protein BDR07DRAFT_1399009 [Suillus spraguei]|nr:hypothetical protein BDR07DRAFT_1399009 [Suillus spraguei]